MDHQEFRAATVTLSDRCARGEAQDKSGALLGQLLQECGAQLVGHYVLPDEEAPLVELLSRLAGQVDVVLTTGGTGLGPRDITPEATTRVLEKRLPGMEEALHRAGSAQVPTAMLSRAVAGVRGRCLIANLPGSPGAVRDAMAVLTPVLAHAVRLLCAQVSDCGQDLVRG